MSKIGAIGAAIGPFITGAQHAAATPPAKHKVSFPRYLAPAVSVFMADADGEDEHALMAPDEMAYSPSYAPDGQSDFFRVHPDGSGPGGSGVEQLTDYPAFDDRCALSPDGNRLAFASTRGSGFANIPLMDLGSKKTTQLTNTDAGNFRAKRSPDGQWIASSSEGEATEHLVPAFSRGPDFDLVLSEPFPAFSPDGSEYQTAPSRAIALELSDPFDTGIAIMNADGTGQCTLFRRSEFSVFPGACSPKGDQMALLVGRYLPPPGLPPAQIGLIVSDGSDFHPIVDEETNSGFPTGSPDGARLVYKCGRQLVILTLASGVTTPLTEASHYCNFPQWSPKGDLTRLTSDAMAISIFTWSVPTEGTCAGSPMWPAQTRIHQGAPGVIGSYSRAAARGSRTKRRSMMGSAALRRDFRYAGGGFGWASANRQQMGRLPRAVRA